MTGGVAWVLDEDGYLLRHCNTETVRIDPIGSESESEELLSLIAQHARWTSSTFAATVMSDWESWRSRFLAVRPIGAAGSTKEAEVAVPARVGLADGGGSGNPEAAAGQAKG